jgi:hypothetical protein
MRRLVVVLLGGVALILPATATATAGAAPAGARSGVEKVVFVDYAAGAPAQQRTASASATNFHLLGGHPSWGTASVTYSVDATHCTGDCTNAAAAVENAFNTWEVSGIAFTASSTGDANPCGGTDSVTWAPIDGPGGTLAATSVCRIIATKQIVGFQTVFDSGDVWSDSGAAGRFDIQATATHEEGHSIGLDHVHSPFDARLTMYPFISPGDIGFRRLGCGDRLGVNALYGTTLDCTGVPLD